MNLVVNKILLVFSLLFTVFLFSKELKCPEVINYTTGKCEKFKDQNFSNNPDFIEFYQYDNNDKKDIK